MADDLPSPRRRILLKLSGELLAGGSGTGLDRATIDGYAAALVDCLRAGYAPGVVTGGGNFIRGARIEGMTRWRADCMGMLATVMNCLALQDAIERAGAPAVTMGAFPAGQGVEPFDPASACGKLDSGFVVLYAGGTGNPFLTTDTAAALRAAQTGCELLLKGTKVDGVYDGDPATTPGARRFDRLSYDEVLGRDLRVMDAAAVAVCRDSSIPLVVFDATRPGNIREVLRNPSIGTAISEE